MAQSDKTTPTVLTVDQIWEGDLLSRKKEAAHVVAYIESVAARPVVREDKRAFTIAIDAPYGEGKTYFLKRLAKQLEINHPVAFIDAWGDDLADEPLTALVATLQSALAPFLSNPEVKARFGEFMARAGDVAKIAAKGLLRRGIGLAIGAGAVEGAEAVWTGVSEDVSEAIVEVAKGLADDVGEAPPSLTSHSIMENRVADFKKGQAAVRAMKQSLAALVASIKNADRKAPIIVVIDELDRCRPTYAIKLLEEIKHLFDVDGLVFIMAIHGEQLGYSVSGSYGPSFNGRSYLRRFIDRE
jgi:KAP family P-loop domain